MKLEDIAKLIEAATPGPWHGQENVGFGVQIPQVILMRGNHGDYMSRENALFIIRARELLPKLLRVAEAARQAIESTAHPRDCVVDGHLLCTCWQQDVKVALAGLEARE